MRVRGVGAPTGESERRGYAIGKRFLDLACAACGLLLLVPVWIGVALLIRLTSAGPVIYRQVRCGKDGRLFTCYKFRTMEFDAHRRRHELIHLNHMTGPVFKVRNDPRVTSVGRYLRKFSIDEVPQLLNVLYGEMSLVGPRPATPEEVSQYSARERGRLSVKPGLTCLWQVSGRSHIGFEQWIALDLEYIDRRSFVYDLWLIGRTVPAVITGRGAF